MPLRRSHTKSHHGCAQCKQRRIKCDESRPCCGSCERKGLACTFRSITLPNHSLLGLAEVGANSLAPGLRESSQLPLVHLELLNHWHTTTAQSLADAKPLEGILRTIVPERALLYPFLMHSLLAVSALHLSHTSPPQRRRTYIEAAMTHNNMSLALSTTELSHITRENCDALLVFASLVSVFSFAIQSPRGSPNPHGVDDLIKIFKLMRGVGSIVFQGRAWIEAGSMRPLLQVGKFPQSRSTAGYALELRDRLLKLDLHHSSVGALFKSKCVNPVLSRSIQHLLDLLELYLDTEDPRAITAWPVVIEEKFLDLLHQREPVSFIVLSYYGAALEMLAGSWWLEGWGGSLISLSKEYLGPDIMDVIPLAPGTGQE